LASRHSYGPDPSQFAELTGSGPVAVLIHGGFWRDRYDLRLMDPLVADLADRGWAALNIEYRRLGSGGGVPATLEDVRAALDAIDPPECVTIGHSAGGHLAAYLADNARVTRVVAQAGVLDLARARELRLSSGVVDEFLGGHPTSEASPIERLPMDAEFLLTHGALDTNVPLEISERFAAASGATLHVEPDEDHFGHLHPTNPLGRAVLAWL
jgi:pimeloyl-ACP methyl ester carboxylesterase